MRRTLELVMYHFPVDGLVLEQGADQSFDGLAMFTQADCAALCGVGYDPPRFAQHDSLERPARPFGYQREIVERAELGTEAELTRHAIREPWRVLEIVGCAGGRIPQHQRFRGAAR